MVVCASKSYLAQYGVPEKPADLTNHSWLEYSVRPDNEFELIAPEGISTRLLPEGRFVTNDPMTISRWLVAGAGIAYVPLMWVINEINSGCTGDPLPALSVRSASGVRVVYRERQTATQGSGVHKLSDRVFCGRGGVVSGNARKTKGITFNFPKSIFVMNIPG
jgi:DNA-binding transcriptional LysR family regulator